MPEIDQFRACVAPRLRAIVARISVFICERNWGLTPYFCDPLFLGLAVTDDEIEDIWRAVPDGAMVEIQP